MLLSVVVSLYTSRVVLEVLGVEDYGIYGLVGGVVAMFSFLNSTMAGATSRFLTFEMGRGDQDRLKATFSSALIIHIGIALLVLILAETVGLWFLNNKLVIPEGRMHAAHWVFQCSIISAMLTITQVPYNSLIIAHERMGVYAYIEILHVILKLLIVYLLTLCEFDKLKLYSSLVLSVSLIVIIIYRVYCIRNFPESHFYIVFKAEIIRPMLSFSGWDLYGNMSVVVFIQGISVILNVFLGPVVNAANNIANTVQGVIKGFAFNIIQAFRPQIIKQYSQGKIDSVNHYCILASQYSLLLFSLFAIPLFWKAEYVLTIWLGELPDYSVPFLRILIVCLLFNLANNIVNIPIHACGKMTFFSVVTGTCFLLSLPIMYFALKKGVSVEVAYMVPLVSYILSLITSIAVLKRNIPAIDLTKLFLQGYCKFVVCIIPSIISLSLLSFSTLTELVNLIIGIVVNAILLGCCTYNFIMGASERKKCRSWIESRFNSILNSDN